MGETKRSTALKGQAERRPLLGRGCVLGDSRKGGKKDKCGQKTGFGTKQVGNAERISHRYILYLGAYALNAPVLLWARRDRPKCGLGAKRLIRARSRCRSSETRISTDYGFRCEVTSG
jgi:hypothetical protein